MDPYFSLFMWSLIANQIFWSGLTAPLEERARSTKNG